MASSAASAEPPRPRWPKNSESLASSSRASFGGTVATAASSSPPASASAGSSAMATSAVPSSAPSFRSFFAFSSPRRRPRRAMSSCLKSDGWKSTPHCWSAPSTASSCRYAAPAAPTSSLALPSTCPSIASSARPRGTPSPPSPGSPAGRARHSQISALAPSLHACSMPAERARTLSSDTCSMSTCKSREKVQDASLSADQDAAFTFSSPRPLQAPCSFFRAPCFAFAAMLPARGAAVGKGTGA